jgi:hypothetical protein
MSTCTSSVSELKSQTCCVGESARFCYETDQQVKLISLQAEVESLLQQLQNLNEQRLAATGR